MRESTLLYFVAALFVGALEAEAGRWRSEGGCAPRLWIRPTAVDLELPVLGPATRALLLEEAREALRHPPMPVRRLASSGLVDPEDPRLIATRRGFRDADEALILAVAHRLTGEASYAAHAEEILRSWADENEPTGHPIDETRLEGFVWAYDLLRCRIGESTQRAVRRWFAHMLAAKGQWRFGSRTALNNHRTHQIKMRLLLARVLDDEAAFDAARRDALAHAEANLLADGDSVDYQQRDALTYHVYNLEAWLEIVLVAQCCELPVKRAYRWLMEKMEADERCGEFLASAEPLDLARSAAGLLPVERGGCLPLERVARVAIVYSTLTGEPLPGFLGTTWKGSGGDARTAFWLLRRKLWR